MADKTFNIYCDESCHLEHDHKRFMFLGSVHCAFPEVKRHTAHINALKSKHHFFAEIKWTNVSLSKWEFYEELIQYFFESGMCFLAVGIDKSQIHCAGGGQPYDDFYYRMYGNLLNAQVDTACHYDVYLDIKDTWSSQKVKRMKESLNTEYGVFRKVQCIRSEESLLLQLADFFTGALAYRANDAEKKNVAKVRVLEMIKGHCYQEDVRHTTCPDKFTLFYIHFH